MDIIKDIIYPVLDELKEEEDLEFTNSENLLLYGEDETVLDSLSLVDFLVGIQDKTFEVTGKHIVLASAKALSNTNSPFRSVKTLSEYIQGLL